MTNKTWGRYPVNEESRPPKGLCNGNDIDECICFMKANLQPTETKASMV